MPSAVSDSGARDEGAGQDRRGVAERRGGPTRLWDSLCGRSRRHRGRRTQEAANTYVDAYQRRDLLLLMALFGLNILDALFTLIWLGKGGAERNPLMQHLIESGDQVFINVKLFISGIAFLVLMAHKNFQIARVGLRLLFAVYAILFLYHVYLQLARF